MKTDEQYNELAQLLASSPKLTALLNAERAAAEAAMAEERAAWSQRIAELEQERDRLRASHERLRLELELFKRRLFIAKAERVDTAQLQLEFQDKMQQLETLAGTLGMVQQLPEPDPTPARDGKRRGNRKHNRGTGRRDLLKLPLEEERIEISDPYLEALVAEGKVTRHGFEETYKLAHKRGGKRRLVIARVRYKTVDAEGNTDVITTPMPEEMLPSAIAAPSLSAHVIMENIGQGMPLFRQEDSFSRDRVPMDRGTLSRWKNHVGEKLDGTVVQAMREHALSTAFCIATDATGVCIQPIGNGQNVRQPCSKGHFLAMLADKDHVLFEYLERETSDAIYERFRGFSGYVQADAKSVFNLLFASADQMQVARSPTQHDGCERIEVGCWYHCRRRFWEAAVSKSVIGREGLMRIGRIFELDASWHDKPAPDIKRLRDTFLRPHVEDFFAWVEQQRPVYEPQRGYTRTAINYAHNHQDALRRFFDDGRLVLSNNGPERAIKAVALGRKAWLFCGSDDHAKSTAALFSLVASARLHGLDPEEYLRCLIRLVPLWPVDRMLELSPLFWKATRQRLDPKALKAEFGPITVPSEPLDTTVRPAPGD